MVKVLFEPIFTAYIISEVGLFKEQLFINYVRFLAVLPLSLVLVFFLLP